MSLPTTMPSRLLLASLAALAVLTTGCAGGDALADDVAAPELDDSDTDTQADGAEAPSEVEDGTHEGRLVSITTSAVTLDLVEVLSGPEAVEAAKAAGVPLDDGGTLPNDVFVNELDTRVTVPVAADGAFQIYDCTAGCELVDTTLAALSDGSAVPYGGTSAIVTATVDAGSVVQLAEIYLP